MRADPYPGEEELDRIRRWPPTESYHELMAYVGKLWSYPERWKREGAYYWLSTGGWSGNEDLVGALQRNHLFWGLCWVSSRRGGAFEFEVPRPFWRDRNGRQDQSAKK